MGLLLVKQKLMKLFDDVRLATADLLNRQLTREGQYEPCPRVGTPKEEACE
jgi:hypothetical protein